MFSGLYKRGETGPAVSMSRSVHTTAEHTCSITYILGLKRKEGVWAASHITTKAEAWLLKEM